MADILHFPRKMRSTTEIWEDLIPLRMVGDLDKERRELLEDELAAAVCHEHRGDYAPVA